MNNFLLFSKILGKPWAIDYREAFVNTGLLSMVLDDHSLAPAFFEQALERYGSNVQGAVRLAAQKRKVVSYPRALDEAEDKKIQHNSTAVIPLTGSLMKEGGWCSYGMEDMGNWIKAADADDRISNILLWIDSPGGTVDGTQALADIVAAAQKPVLAFVDGLMASAAFWIGSAAQKVVARNTTTEIGSVGVVLSFADFRPIYEREGAKFHTILSRLSTDKNKEFYEALKDNYAPMQDLSLDPLAQMFINAIKANRPASAEHEDQWSTGMVFFAEEAKNLGLIDEVADFDAALDLLNEMTPDENLKTYPKTLKQRSMEYPKLLKAMGLESVEASDEGVFLNAEQLAAIEAALAPEIDMSEELESLTQRLAETTASLEEATASLAAGTETLNRLEADKLELTTTNATLTEHNAGLTAQIATLQAEVKALGEQDEEHAGGAHSDSDYQEASAFAPDPEAQALFATRKKLGK